MKKIAYCLLLFAVMCAMPHLGQAEENKMPSWEGIYCNKATDKCMRIYEQGASTVGDAQHYAQVMFYSDKGSAFIAEGELSLTSPTEASIFLLHITPSADRKSMKIVQNPYFESWGDDPISNYGDSLLFGDYILEK